MLDQLLQNLSVKARALAFAESMLRDLDDQVFDHSAPLLGQYAREPFVVFCGAGISIPNPAGAPSFFELRDAIIRTLLGMLARRSVLSSARARAVIGALEALPKRTDIAYPPEMIFSELAAVGVRVDRLLASLDQGQPNGNHGALAKLAGEGQLAGVVTPNFDTYIERAARSPFRQMLPGLSWSGRAYSFPLLKPHGSLDYPDSIAVTMESVLVRPPDSILAELERLCGGRVVIVVGYSGWDHDLFPLLAHAGRRWDARIIWVLWDRESLNENVIKLQSALDDRCMVVQGNGRPVLADLAGLPVGSPAPKRDLEAKFAEILADCDTMALIAAVSAAVAPLGVEEYEEICADLLEQLLIELKRSSAPDAVKLDHLIRIAQTEDPDLVREAAKLGEVVARRLGDQARLRYIEYLCDPRAKGDRPSDQLFQIEFELQEDFPVIRHTTDPMRMRHSLRLNTEIEKAELALQEEEMTVAMAIAERLLSWPVCARGGFSREVWLMKDSSAEGRVRSILAQGNANRGEIKRAEHHLCRALDVLWQEMDFFEFSFALEAVPILAGTSSQHCLELASHLLDRLQAMMPSLSPEQ